ncbi:hypothetical protein [Colwellia sp. Arc7-D]|uniref:hypothetical protein n=1 Tax=Colwellia sp. Arc7-D TaxID=2161872 RepID=UPI000D3D00A7|nr:hypothetical protein [Colwellia sp. Arc7-D]AWB56230.1 hypothetical protein DBO93_00700 [Colwellia sp. Arc7-D]
MKFTILLLMLITPNIFAEENGIFIFDHRLKEDTNDYRSKVFKYYLPQGAISYHSSFYIEVDGFFVPKEQNSTIQKLRNYTPVAFSALDGFPIFRITSGRGKGYHKMTKNDFIRIGKSLGINTHGEKLIDIDGTIYVEESYKIRVAKEVETTLKSN